MRDIDCFNTKFKSESVAEGQQLDKPSPHNNGVGLELHMKRIGAPFLVILFKWGSTGKYELLRSTWPGQVH